MYHSPVQTKPHPKLAGTRTPSGIQSESAGRTTSRFPAATATLHQEGVWPKPTTLAERAAGDGRA